MWQHLLQAEGIRGILPFQGTTCLEVNPEVPCEESPSDPTDLGGRLILIAHFALTPHTVAFI